MIDLAASLYALSQQFREISWATLSWHVLIAYGLSWLYFFSTLHIFTRVFGNIIGSVLNYGISWILLIVVVFALQKLNSIQSSHASYDKK